MARLLVLAENQGDRLLKGDIATVQADGHVWGRLEGLPRFVRIDLPGTSEEWSPLTRGTLKEDPETGEPIQDKRREKGLSDARVDEAIANGGQLTLTRGQFNNSLVNR